MTSLLERAKAGEQLADLNIIDLHGHLGRIDFTIPDISPAAMVAEMDRIGIQAIACSSMQCLGACPEWGNAQVFKAMQAFPGRILGYVSVIPENADDTRKTAEKWLNHGFIGIKLHNASGIDYDAPACMPVYEIAHARRLPVLFHTWGAENEFAQIRNIAGAHPEARLLLAHAGSANEAGYIRIANEFPNVFLDLAFSRSPRGLVRRLVESVGVKKVVWGSDSYFFSQAQQIGKVLGADMSDADKLMILSGNARRILAGSVSTAERLNL